MPPETLFDKIWEAHEVAPTTCCTSTCTSSTRSPARRRSTACASPGARCAGPIARSPRPTTTCRPTARRSPRASSDELSRVQVETLERNCEEFGIPLYSLGSEHQGIVHVIGPELGVTQPGMTIVCGDSHTATHGAFGALAFGIGTSEVEHVLATQCLVQRKPQVDAHPLRGRARLRRDGQGPDPRRRSARWASTAPSATSSSTPGPPIEALSMEGRMTVCNMTIEGGGRAGMIAPDDTTFAWVASAARRSIPAWGELRTDDGASFDREVVVDARALSPMVSWGTNPAQVVGGRRERPRAGDRRRGARAALHGAAARHADARRSASTACSSARARTRGSATCAPPRRWSRGARWPPTSTRWSSPARCR